MLISIPEAAKILGVSRSTAYRLVKDGRIPCVRSFGPVRVHEQMLRQLIDEEVDGFRAQSTSEDGQDGRSDLQGVAGQSLVAQERELDRLLKARKKST